MKEDGEETSEDHSSKDADDLLQSSSPMQDGGETAEDTSAQTQHHGGMVEEEQRSEQLVNDCGTPDDEQEEDGEEEEDTSREKSHSAEQIRERVRKTKLYVTVESHQWPIVYSPHYNISFLGFEKLHPFDSGKWGKVYNFLKEEGLFCDQTTIQPLEASEDDLLVAHTKQYLNRLKWSISVAGITEIPPVAMLPNFIVQRKVLRPLRYQTGGTILATHLALERGWAINIGGGFHHCSSKRGGGFCAYADITLALRFLLAQGRVQRAMIVDLDAHQGNGHERDFMSEGENVYILDVYNRHIYPRDGYAKRGIKRKVEVDYFTADERYLTLVASNLEAALDEFVPDIMVYNAGTDSLEGDPLGALSISPQGIIKRDMMVFEFARDRRKPIPIVMVTSGGYQRNNAEIIASSISNLRKRNLIGCPEAEEFQAKLASPPTTPSSSQPPASPSEAPSPDGEGTPSGPAPSRGFFSSLRSFMK